MVIVEDEFQYTDLEAYPGCYLHHEKTPNYLEIVAENDLVMRVYTVSDHILRFRYAIEGIFDNDFSYALDPAQEPQTVSYEVQESTDAIMLVTAVLKVRIEKRNLSVRIMDLEGNILNEDEKGFHWEKNADHGGYIVQMTKRVQFGEAFYGLGDKPTDLNLKGKRFVNWGTDEYGYSKDTDPLYKSIPIYYGLHSGLAYGMFFDNTFKAFFDFGMERSKAMSFWAQGGEMNYYFIAGPDMLDIARRYTLLTGTPDLPPMWSLGYQQCKWSYYPESKVREIADKMRELRIPCDAIYLDIDYMDGFRCFTWDPDRFPEPKKMVDDLREQGYQTMVIIDPGIKKDKNYSVYQEGMEKGYFCKRVDGPYVEGKVWPGDCYFPDFTRPEVRDWWAGLYKGLIEEVGVAGVWNDMNEPALFEVPSKTFPLDVVHDYDGNTTSHRKAHNVYGMQMARATADGVKMHRGGKRTLIITRSGYSGLQRYSSVWTGDNIATWEHLWLADVQAQRLAVSGISFCGSDIGGFIEQPTPELMMRWIQLGIFHPFCRVHSSGDHGDQEPWSFGEQCVEVFRKFVELRYQLLPYMYTAFYQYHKFGTPMLRPIVFLDQHDVETVERDHEFLCGDHFLVCPVVEAEAQERKVYIPNGTWYSYWDDTQYTGGSEQIVPAPIDQIPFLIKAGAVVPTYPIQQYVGELEVTEVTLHIYHTAGAEDSFLYEDDADTYDYEKGHNRYVKFSAAGAGDGMVITRSVEGSYESNIKSFKLVFHGFATGVNAVTVDGQSVDTIGDVVINAEFGKLEIS